MGSTGSGSFTDYSKRKSSSGENKDGGSSSKDICGKAFSAKLEDVSRCFFYMHFEKVPALGTEVKVFFNGVRMAVETEKGEEIGYLPTKFNYIRTCLADKFSYVGQVVASSMKPVPSVTVDMTPA